MKVFVSSLIGGYEAERQCVKGAIESLGHTALMAEDFQAQTSSPQVACLAAVRDSDIVVLLLGERYGMRQPSGLSATHEEYREARGKKQVLAFVQDGVAFDPEQSAFVEEVQGWESGLFRMGFASAQDLGPKVTRALHEWQLANAVGPVDPLTMLTKAMALLPEPDSRHASSESALRIAVVGGPAQSILRPREIENRVLHDEMAKTALFPPHPIFDIQRGTSFTIRGDSLVLSQNEGRGERGAVSLSPRGEVVLTLPLGQSEHHAGLPVLIEEDVEAQLIAGLYYVNWLLEQIDPTQRLTHVALIVQVSGGGFLAWRTRSEHAESPNSVSQSFGFGEEHHAPVHLDPAHVTRATLRMETGRLAEDLLSLLRRNWRQGH